MKRIFAVFIVGVFAIAVSAQTSTGTAATTTGSAAGQANTTMQGPGQGAAGAAGSAAGEVSGATQTQSGSTSAALASGTQIQAMLTKTVDAKKAQVGDEVTAKVTKDVKDASGNVVLPKNSKLFGRVTNVQAKGKGEAEQNSGLAILFERAVLKSGGEMKMNMLIANVSAPRPVSDYAAPSTEMGAGTGGEMRGNAGAAGPVGGAAGTATGTLGGTAAGVGNTVGGVAGSTANTVGSTVGGTTGGVTGTTTAGAGAAVSGVAGVPNVMINTQASNTTNGTVFVGRGENVRLNSGTDLVLNVAAQ